MNTLKAKGNWQIARGKRKPNYAQLTDDYLCYAEGREDELIGRMPKRTGETKALASLAVKDGLAGEERPLAHKRGIRL